MSLKVYYAPLPFPMSQPGLDTEAYAQVTQESGFDGTHFHVLSEWCRDFGKPENDVNMDFWWWNRFDDIRKIWSKQLRDILVSFAKRGMDVMLTVHSQYSDKIDFEPYPLSALTPKELYESDKFRRGWLKWTSIDSDPTADYGLSREGLKLRRFYRALARIIKGVKAEYPESNHIITQYNEENSSLTQQGMRKFGRGGEGKIKKWFIEQCLGFVGLELDKRLKFSVNFETYLYPAIGGGPKNYHPTKWLPNAKSIRREFGRFAMFECHNIGSPEEAAIVADDFNPNFTIFHTDATRDLPDGIAETKRYLEQFDTTFIIKAGNAGPVPRRLLENNTAFIVDTAPKCGRLL